MHSQSFITYSEEYNQGRIQDLVLGGGGAKLGKVLRVQLLLSQMFMERMMQEN